MDESEKLKILNEVLSHSRKSIFYNDRVPDRPLRSLDDLKQIPLTTKDDVRQNSPFGLVCVPRKELYQYHETFGTTGVPASAWLTREDVDDLAHRVNLGGVNFCEDDMVLIRFPYAISTVAHFMHHAAQMKNACVIPASSRNTISPFTRIINLMSKLEVSVLACLPVQAVLLAETAELLGMKPDRDFPKLRMIYTAGECLTPRRRKLIEGIWGVPVNDNYGMTEIGPAVVDCEYGCPHKLDEYFMFEVLRDDLQTDVSPGEIGNLVITTLSRKATPLIRYLTGDRAQILSKECPCGRNETIQIRGRKQDLIRIGDVELDQWDLEEILSYLPGGRFWAAGPTEKGLKFALEVDNKAEFLDFQLLKDLEEKYKINMTIEFVPRGTLYDRSELLSVGLVGKPRYIYTAKEMSEKAYLNSSKN